MAPTMNKAMIVNAAPQATPLTRTPTSRNAVPIERSPWRKWFLTIDQLLNPVGKKGRMQKDNTARRRNWCATGLLRAGNASKKENLSFFPQVFAPLGRPQHYVVAFGGSGLYEQGR